MFKNLTLAITLFASAALAQYGARTDTNIAPYPATAPAIGNGCITDPAFGSTVCAVTNSSTDPKALNTNFSTANYAGSNSWNANSTSFFFYGYGGTLWLATFDPNTGQVTKLTKNGFGNIAHAEWSFTSPTIAYGTPAYPLIEEWNNGIVTTIHDARPDYTASPIPYADEFSVSGDGTRMAFVAGTVQDVFRLAYVWDTGQGYSYLDTTTMTVTGQWGTTGPLVSQPLQDGSIPVLQPVGIHNGRLSRNGQWMWIESGSTPQDWLWKVGTNQVWAFPSSGLCTAGLGSCGHYAVGFDTFYASDGSVYPGTYIPSYWVSTPLNGTTFSPLTPLVSEVMLNYKQSNQNYDYHISANAKVASSDSSPVLVSTEYNWATQQGVGVQPTALSPYQNEIDGLCTNCATPTVWRFAHTEYTYGTGVSPCCGPTADISQDGNWAIFTSNWADTRGTTSSGAYRTDVFTVKLLSAH